VPANEFLRQCTISDCACSIRIVLEDGFAEAWRFTQTNAARDDGLVYALAKVRPHIGHHLCAEPRSTVEHRHDNATELEALVRAGIAHLLDQSHNFDQTLKREIFALYRGQQFIRGGERVAHQDAKRRGTIQ